MTDVDVFGWLADRTGCGTLRIMKPLDVLTAETGITTGYDEKLKTKGFMPAVLIGQRVCKDGPSAIWQHVAGNEHRPKLVFEVDDDLFNVDASNNDAYQWFINGYDKDSASLHDVRGNLIKNIQAADRVTCTTQALADLVGQWNDDVRIVPNYMPRWMTERERPHRDRLTVGWIGSGTHSMDWTDAQPQVRRFLERNPAVDFKIIGARYGEELKFPKGQTVQTGWFTNVDECWKAIDFDIGIAPLRPHLFNRSKSAIKFLEYASLGIPTVASDVGPYAENIVHGETGFLIKRDHEWGQVLRMLANDADMRNEIGANAKKWAQTQILEENIGEWKSALCDW